jgi:hypothetical protein
LKSLENPFDRFVGLGAAGVVVRGAVAVAVGVSKREVERGSEERQ